MKHCDNCGKEINDNVQLCDACGKTAGQSAQNAAKSFAKYDGRTYGDFDPADIETNKIMALLSYLGFLFIVPLLAAPKSPFARFHMNQGLVLFLAEIAISIVISIVSFILSFIPVLGFIISILLSLVGFAIPVVFAIMGILNAYKGIAKDLPIIGKVRIMK